MTGAVEPSLPQAASATRGEDGEGQASGRARHWQLQETRRGWSTVRPPLARGEPVAGVDEEESEQLGDVEHFHVAHARERAADSRQDRADADEHVADRPMALPGNAREVPRRPRRAPGEQDEGVDVDEGADEAHPVPLDHLPRGARGLHQRVVDRGQHHRDRPEQHDDDQGNRQFVRGGTAAGGGTPNPGPAGRRQAARRRCTRGGRAPRASRTA